MRALTLVVTLGTILTGSAAAQVESDSARLQGSWAMVSGSANGAPMPATFAATMRRVLQGNHLTVTMGGEVYFEATVQFDEAKSPREIDYHMTAGPTSGTLQRGIYRISGDTVHFAFALPGEPRPDSFSSTSGDGRTVSAWVHAR